MSTQNPALPTAPSSHGVLARSIRDVRIAAFQHHWLDTVLHGHLVSVEAWKMRHRAPALRILSAAFGTLRAGSDLRFGRHRLGGGSLAKCFLVCPQACP